MKYVDEAICGKLTLPTVPSVVRRVMNLLRESQPSTYAIRAELCQDPVLTARVLRLANSPYFAGHRTLSSIDEAVTTVGTQALNTLVVSSGLISAFVEVRGVHLRDFWRHASVTANAARGLARQSGANFEAAYLAGLLHESGHLILCQAFPENAARLFENRRTEHGRALSDLEDAAFGARHPAVSAYWCDHMQLPHEVADALAFYLEPSVAAPESLAPVIHLASLLAAAIEANDTAEQAFERLGANILRKARLDAKRFERDFEDTYAALRSAPTSL